MNEALQEYVNKNSLSYIDNILQSSEEMKVIYKYINYSNNISGQIAEIGVYTGYSAKLIANFKNKTKKLFLCDTFSGLSDVCESDNLSVLNNGAFSASIFKDITDFFANDKTVKVIAGYFPKSSIKEMDEEKYAFVHIDCDTYLSTLNCLKYFYPKMSINGIILLHDYDNNPHTVGVTQAVNEFLLDKKEQVELHGLGSSQCSIIKS